MLFALAAAAIAAFSNGLRGAFVLDDIVRIVENPTIHSFWPPPIPGSLASRPILHLSLALNYAAGGLDPWGYHLVNLAIHVLATLTLFGVVRRTLGMPRIPARLAARAPELAFAVALLWSLHPLQTQAVTYIVQRGESLASLFYLLTLYAVIRSAGSPHPARWAAAAIGACALGMGTKEIGATAPIVVALYDRIFLAGSVREMARKRGLLYGALAATMILPFWLVARVPGGESTGFIEGVKPIGPVTYALTQCAVLVHYLRLVVWPSPLVLDYGWRPAGSFGEVAGQAALLLALLLATVWALRRRPPLGFVAAAFFLVLAPTSSIIPIADPAFEHRMYLPLAAVVVLIVLAGDAWLQRFEPRAGGGSGPSHLVRTLALGALALVLGSLTARRNLDYKDPLTIWSDVVSKRPQNQRAQFNLGYALELLGRYDESLEHYREAVRIAPDYPDAQVNLGLALVRKGEVEEGIEHYRSALALKKDWPVVHYDLGIAWKRLGKFEEALASQTESLRLQPDSADAHNEIGSVLFSLKRQEEASGHFREAIRLRPGFAEAHYNLGLMLYQLGRKDEASKSFREAIRLRPDYPEACNNLGAILHQSGQVDEAIGLFEKALQLKPDYADAKRNLDVARQQHDHGKSGG